MTAVSARPDNLTAYWRELLLMDWDLQSTANNLRQTLQTYRTRCKEFGADHTQLAYSLGQHTTAMKQLDEWVGRVGEAFRQADRAPGQTPEGIVLTTEKLKIRDGWVSSLVALAGAAAILGIDTPPIPGPPPNPPTDPGAGKYDSDPWYSKGKALIAKGLAADAVTIADAIGWTHAAAHLRHYLGNSGADFTVDPDEIMRDVGRFQGEVDKTVSVEMRRVAAQAATYGTYGKPVQFSTGWEGYYILPEDSKDWFYAMGGIQYSVTGVATVYPPDYPGGQSRIKMDYRVHVFDRYNWDERKKTKIGPITISDESMAEMHRAGVAQEFNMSGSTETKHYAGAVPLPGQQPQLPQPPDNRNGTRTDSRRS